MNYKGIETIKTCMPTVINIVASISNMNSLILDEPGLRLARPTVCSLQASLHYQLITTTSAQNLLGWDTVVGVSPPAGSSPQLTVPDFRLRSEGLGHPKTTKKKTVSCVGIL